MNESIGEMREAIGKALLGFADAPLREGATAVLNALGYASERTADAGSVAEFLDRYETGSKLTEKQRALFESWQEVELVFQVTDEEIAGPGDLFTEDGFDAGRIRSFVFIAVELASGPYSRTRLAEMTRALNRLFEMPAMLLLRCEARFSLAVIHRRPHRRDDSRDVLEKVTLVKDVEVRAPHRAHLDILADLALPRMVDDRNVASFEDLHRAWEDALDTEELNRRFYRELFEWFERAIEECEFPDDGAGEGSLERQVIRLITRLLFIWFLKEKGLVPDDLFTEAFAGEVVRDHAPDATNYYRAVMQNLFFATLNTEIGSRAFSAGSQRTHRDFTKYRYRKLLTDPDGFLAKLKKVPFVNGGLFDCLDDFESVTQGGRRIDAFTDNIDTQGRGLHVPANILLDPEDGLFPLFRRFKFTVEENTPLDQEVALDPELLGRVFENLLAAYNPETRNTVRKATGSYYTPRRIVDYMVDEALAAALAERVEAADGDASFLKDRLRYLLDYQDAFNDAAGLFEPGETAAIVRAIANLRVLDPAVGSGAFPMGVLHKLTLALRRLDPQNLHWERFQKELAGERAAAAFESRGQAARDAELLEISSTFEAYRDSDFGRKLYLIQNSIFGVDLQPVACQIARLRFFISLTVEQQGSDDPADNYGIRPLPNLETRIVAANTLIGIAAKKQITLGEQAIQDHMARLAHVREMHFNARTRNDKLRLREEDATWRRKLASALEEGGYGHDESQKVAGWDLYSQNVAADWFDPQWMFGVTDGFDVVIGNPPYVESRNSLISDEMKSFYGKQVEVDWEYTLPRGSDLLIYFYSRSPKFLSKAGVGCYITQNAWLSTDYGKKFQEFSVGRFSFDKIIDTSSKFFTDTNSQNINTIITTFSLHKRAPISYGVADSSLSVDSWKMIEASQKLKWGHIFSMPPFFMEILTKMERRQNLSHRITFGQGLNPPKKAISDQGEIALLDSKSVKFVASSTESWINRGWVNSKRLNKVPALVMPRGIGDRHYCTFNRCRALSYSCVEVYIPDDLWETDMHYSLWAYLNTSFVWLFREITGRKNLGGGLLKAEATDMKFLPVGFDFSFGREARNILQRLRRRNPLPAIEEISTEEHRDLNDMVGEYFGYQEICQDIADTLKQIVNFRINRSAAR